jgi:hypothetical protein
MVVRQGCHFSLNLFTAYVGHVREIIQDKRDKYSNQSTNCIIMFLHYWQIIQFMWKICLEGEVSIEPDKVYSLNFRVSKWRALLNLSAKYTYLFLNILGFCSLMSWRHMLTFAPYHVVTLVGETQMWFTGATMYNEFVWRTTENSMRDMFEGR